jgi:hypothetical protein
MILPEDRRVGITRIIVTNQRRGHESFLRFVA